MTQDTLSDLLRGVRLRGAVFFDVSGSGDWAAEAPPGRELAPLLMPGVEHVMEYHAVAQGSCWAGIPGGPSVQLAAGDIVMFPQGDAHVVSSAPGLRGAGEGVSWLADARSESLPLELAYTGRGVLYPKPDDAGADVTIICGFLGCDLRPFNPLIAALPRMLHLRASASDRWMADFARQAVVESRAHRSGGEALLARMSEMMFVNAVRRYADDLSAEGVGWLAGLNDRFVGRTLALMHEQPAHDWTVDEFGRLVGLSRSALHERFVQLIGMPPMQYLAQWRMQVAARALLETRASIASVALEVGYDSDAAFTRAFKRAVGMPPAAWRREHDEGAISRVVKGERA
jgi:AraC-like DNA-binding protein